jgi:hypothetical protein
MRLFVEGTITSSQMANHRSILFFCALLLSSLNAGCAHWEFVRHIDVTHDPDYQAGYRAGETYELKTTAYLMQNQPEDKSEDPTCSIWTADRYQQWATPPKPTTKISLNVDELIIREMFPPGWFRCVATLHSGTRIHIERLEYSYGVRPLRDLSPLDPGPPRPPEMVAYSTVKCAGSTWRNVIAPYTYWHGPNYPARKLVTFPNLSLVVAICR